jgi:ketosteroid isomerase-like protein
MHHWPVGALLAFVALTDLPAQATKQQPTSVRPTSSSVEQQLISNEDGWAAALVKRDGAYFRRMLAPGFVYTEDAKVMSRDDVLRDAVSSTDTVTAAHNEDMVVHQPGAVTAVVTGILHVEGRTAGKRWVHRYRFTDTWVKQSDGQWQIVAAQDYLMPAK